MSTRHVKFQDVQRVIENCPPPWNRLFATLLETGARYMEIATLTSEQIGVDSIKIEPHFLPNGTWWKPKRPASLRSIVVTQEIADSLRRNNPKELIFFPHKDHPTYSRTANHFLQKTCKRLQIPSFSTHQLRRVRITQALEAGANPNNVRAAVGHRSLITTIKYMQDVPVRGVLPPTSAEAVPEPVVAQYMFMARPKNWSKA